jgi:tRNA pseudouridine13 synthase
MVAQEEQLVGIEEYLTDTDGIGGKLRKAPEDFLVKEISMTPPEVPNGRWTIATITSRNWETNRLLRMLSKDLRASRDRIKFAGTKDKRAVTSQLMAFKVRPDIVKTINLKDVTVENVYTADRGIDIGDLIGNQFEIKVSDLKMGALDIVKDTATQVKDLEGFPNYFGIQRFGAIRPVTHLVGHAVPGQPQR